MTATRAPRLVLLSVGAAFVLATTARANPAGPPHPEVRPATLRYRMHMQVRPLLPIWISFGDVGDARLTYREDEAAGRVFELLVGSDPQRAPRGTNRWGYIREDVGRNAASVIGVMRQGDEPSPRDAAVRGNTAATGTYAFKIIRSTVRGTACEAVTTVRRFPTDLTARDLARLLDPDAPRETVRSRELTLGRDVQPGLLSALDGLLASMIAARSKGEPIGPKDRWSTTYVFNGRVFDVHVTSLTERRGVTLGGRRYPLVMECAFETVKRTDGQREHFSLTFPVQGPLAGRPVLIVHQMRWWLKAELVLEDAMD